MLSVSKSNALSQPLAEHVGTFWCWGLIQRVLIYLQFKAIGVDKLNRWLSFIPTVKELEDGIWDYDHTHDCHPLIIITASQSVLTIKQQLRLSHLGNWFTAVNSKDAQIKWLDIEWLIFMSRWHHDTGSFCISISTWQCTNSTGFHSVIYQPPASSATVWMWHCSCKIRYEGFSRHSYCHDQDTWISLRQSSFSTENRVFRKRAGTHALRLFCQFHLLCMRDGQVERQLHKSDAKTSQLSPDSGQHDMLDLSCTRY